jgi:hypothetical protein
VEQFDKEKFLEVLISLATEINQKETFTSNEENFLTQMDLFTDELIKVTERR